jgi:putative FmdB family regulatory protein
MPLYEFRCPNGHDFEKFYRSISAAPQSENCPECGEPAERRISAAGLVFKGSGFYITDYGKDGKKAEREASSKGTESKASESKASESKSDAKGESAKSDTASAKPAESKPAASTPAPKKAE